MPTFRHVPGARYQVPGVRCQVPGTRCQVPGVIMLTTTENTLFVVVKNEGWGQSWLYQLCGSIHNMASNSSYFAAT